METEQPGDEASPSESLKAFEETLKLHGCIYIYMDVHTVHAHGWL